MRPKMVVEHPLALDAEEAEELQDDNPMFCPEADGYLGADELMSRYVIEHHRDRLWAVFEVAMYGHSGTVYFWNHQGGYGMALDEDDAWSLAAALAEVA